MQEKVNTLSQKLEKFITSGEINFNLKFVIDNLKNQAFCAAVAAYGLLIIKRANLVPEHLQINYFSAFFLLVIGIILFSMVTTQFFFVLVKSLFQTKFPKLLTIISTTLFFPMVALFGIVISLLLATR